MYFSSKNKTFELSIYFSVYNLLPYIYVFISAFDIYFEKDRTIMLSNFSINKTKWCMTLLTNITTHGKPLPSPDSKQRIVALLVDWVIYSWRAFFEIDKVNAKSQITQLYLRTMIAEYICSTFDSHYFNIYFLIICWYVYCRKHYFVIYS